MASAKYSFPVPNNLYAEQAVLGSMIIDPDACALGLASLTENSFSGIDPRHILIFRAIKAVADRRDPIDVQAIINELINAHCLDEAGGNAYLFELLELVTSPDNVDHYIKIVSDQAVLRDFLAKMDEAKDLYTKTGEFKDIGEFLSKYSQEFMDIASKRSVGEFRSAEVVAKTVEKILEAQSKRSQNGITGIDTGYVYLNRFTHGWQKGNLVVIAARPSVGKTAFAINLAVNAAKKTNKPVAFFSAEMPAEQIMQRILSSEAHVSGDDLLNPMYLDQRKKAQIAEAVRRVSELPIYFDDTPNLPLGELVAKARKLKAAHDDLGLVVIDYLNLLSTEHLESRALEVQFISKSLKELARSLNVPVIALCQLNRDADNNPKGVPMLSNIRESGAIEADADLVLLMYRSDYYSNNGGKKGGTEIGAKLQESVDAASSGTEDKASMSVTEINIAKNRNGRTGIVYFLFSKSYSRFDTPEADMLKQIMSAKNEPTEDLED